MYKYLYEITDEAILRRMPQTFLIGIVTTLFELLLTFIAGMPDKEQRKKILELVISPHPLPQYFFPKLWSKILKEELLDPDVDIERLASETESYSGYSSKRLCIYTQFVGSDLQALCQQAARGPMSELIGPSIEVLSSFKLLTNYCYYFL